MNETLAIEGSKREKVFKTFKYTIYFLLFVNIFYWFREDYLAAAHLYPNGVGLGQLTDAFSQATDTIAWVILLLMFELETSVISDEKLNQGWKWVINAVAAICYIFIVLAFIGYAKKLVFVLGFEPTAISDACTAISQYSSYVLDMDEYAALTVDTCKQVQGTLFVHDQTNFITTTAMHSHMVLMASAEVINAGTWILIVLLLWVDVFVQLRGMEHGRLYKLNVGSKFVLYSILILVCLYWGYDGDFMDFWDAFLWILAFFIIELNIFKWSEEIEAENAAAKDTNVAGANT